MGVSAAAFGDHHAKTGVVTCGCETVDPALARDLAILRTSGRWFQRDNAAHRLGKRSWQRHPEILLALVDALLEDPKDEVREEAAESLGKLSACVPEVHMALVGAAKNDPDKGVRRQAAKSLKALKPHCEGACSACDPSVVIERRVPWDDRDTPILIEERPIPLDAIPPPPPDEPGLQPVLPDPLPQARKRPAAPPRGRVAARLPR
jgi:hypothetical protein